ncbi:hypothetical protein BGC_00250 [Burkholderia sp. 3C]
MWWRWVVSRSREAVDNPCWQGVWRVWEDGTGLSRGAVQGERIAAEREAVAQIGVESEARAHSRAEGPPNGEADGAL